MGRRLRIVLLIESSRGYGRMLLDGVAEYARTYGPWTFYHIERSLHDPVPPRLRQWRPDGVIARLANRTQAAQLRRLGVPVVDLLGEVTDAGIPCVLSDEGTIARAALEHLWDRGFRQLAYVGFDGVKYSDSRRDSLLKYAAEKGCSVEVYQDPGLRQARGLVGVEESTRRHDKPLAEWLRGLPKPVGMMACNDTRAYQVLSVCGQYEIAVPGEVAVIGVNNDPMLCKLSDPPLSSVDPDAHRCGYEGAALIARMIAGKRPAKPYVRLCSGPVVTRQSTDIVMFADGELAAAVQHIREHACDGLTTDDLVGKLAVSRRTLYRWFDRHLGRSPSEEITRVRLERVKDLLATTRLPVEEIARLAGFEFTETMHRLFRTRFGQPPGAYRLGRRIQTQ